jgi:hypothetical protein
VRPAQINGLPGFVIERGVSELVTVAFDFRDGLIVGIYL